MLQHEISQPLCFILKTLLGPVSLFKKFIECWHRRFDGRPPFSPHIVNEELRVVISPQRMPPTILSPGRYNSAVRQVLLRLLAQIQNFPLGYSRLNENRS